MSGHRPFRRAGWRDERGVTLIETLVAMVTAIIVAGALFAILEVSLRQTARLTDVVQVTQLSRTTMTRMVDELHSACLSPGFAPIQENSSENELRFINAYSNQAEIGSAYEHRIVWESSTGTLVDKSYPSNGGSWPKFTFPSNPTTVTRIGENISHTIANKTTDPIFEYYRYSTKSTSAEAESTLSAISISKGTLNKEEAKETASVLIRFNTSPSDKNTALNRPVDLSSQVTLAFSAPNSETPISDSPCQ